MPILNLGWIPVQEDLMIVQVHPDTTTFDRIDRDTKNTLETQLALIGGTMGLLTGKYCETMSADIPPPGFSILSGVEIVFFMAKTFLSLIGSYGGKLEKRNQNI